MNSEPTTFGEDEVVTGMCLWEAMLDIARAPEGETDGDGPVLDEDEGDAGAEDDGDAPEADPQQIAAGMLDDNGSFTIRAALVDLVKPCQEGWAAERDAKGDDAGQFDWDWCPAFLRRAVVDGTMEAAIERQYGS